MTPEETLSALRKVQVTLDVARHVLEVEDYRFEMRQADDALALLPQIIGAVEEGQAGVERMDERDIDHVREKIRGAASDCNVRLEIDQVRYITKAALDAVVDVQRKHARLRAPLPLPPSTRKDESQ